MDDSSATFSRRRFFRRSAAGVALLAGASPFGALLSACAGSEGASAGGSPAAKSTARTGAAGATLTVDSWPIYIDNDPDTGTLARFQQASGIAVTWNETIQDNNEYLASIEPRLKAGRSIEADIAMPTYWLAAQLADSGWLETLPVSSIPNMANLVPSLKNPWWDPSGRRSLPWQTALTGIAYNRSAAGGEVNSLAAFFSPSLKGRVGVLTEMRDTIGLLMLSDGKDPATPSFARAEGAFSALERAKASGHIGRFTDQDYLDDLVAGKLAACFAWSGDVAQLALDNPNIGFAIPEEGGMRFVDCMVIPKGSAHVTQAAAFMNFVYDPANAARITAAVQYLSPVSGVADQLRRMGGPAAALADSPIMFPDAATTARLHTFGQLSASEQVRFDDAFGAIVDS